VEIMNNTPEKKVIKRIDPFRSSNVCRTDLEKYRLIAIELGASDAQIIKSKQVIVEYRVSGKCKIPKCAYYGTNINCPPFVTPVEDMRKMLKEYEYGIFIRIVLPSDHMAGVEAFEEDRIGLDLRKLHEIVSRVESHAFYDGYYLAMGFAGGPCKRAFCHNVECCALISGKGCRHSLMARPAMEAVGINCFKMATKEGWDIYPIGKETSPDDVPYGTRLGLILIY
jgi:predicted metal-binding protein